MDLLKNLGLCYKGDYITQGSVSDKSRKSTQLNINNIEFIVRKDGKDNDYSIVSNLYNGNTIFHLPAINVSQSNLKEVKDSLIDLMKNDIYLVTIDASTLLSETYEWSTNEEQQNYLKNMAKGIATLASNNIPIAIENTNLDKNSVLFGKTVSNIADLLVYSRNTLVEQFDFTRENANNMIGISLNIGNLVKTNEVVGLENWFKVFYNDIKCIKVNNIENTIPLFNQLLDLVINNNVDVPILLETKAEIESIVNEFKKFEYLVKNKLDGKPLNLDGYRNIVNSRYNEYNYNFNSAQSGYTNAIIITMILATSIIAILMFMLQIKH